MPERAQKIEREEPAHPGLTSIEKSMLEHEVAEQIRQVYDPEIPVNVYDLGLIYDITADDERNVHILMTLTSPMCPVAESLPAEVELAAAKAPGVNRVTVELTWDPPFSIDRMSEEVKLMLGFL
jgi:FeS assembly SUF system protein